MLLKREPNQKVAYIIITVSIYKKKIDQFLMSKLTPGNRINWIKNELYCVFEVFDQLDNIYYAKIFNIAALQEHGLY